LQRFHTTLKGAREHAVKNVLDRPFNGSFSHEHRLLAAVVGWVAKGR
jgi:hypothetical protein